MINRKIFSARIGNWLFEPRWLTTVLALLVFSVLVNLGNWQNGRAEEKARWLAALEKSQHDHAIDLSERLQDILQQPEAWQHRRVHLVGIPDPRRTLLLDNQPFDMRSGYHVLTPVQLDETYWVLLNRGWIERHQLRNELPVIPALPEGPLNIDGLVYLPSPRALVLKEDKLLPVWPQVIQKIDIPAIGQLLGVELLPLTVRLAEDSPLDPQLKRHWQVAVMTPEKHHAYALQWYAMAGALAVIYLITNVRRIRPEQAS